MNPNWLGVYSAMLALVAFFVVYWFARTKPTKTRAICSLLAIVASLPGASFAAYYAHIFPEPSWYYQFRSIVGTELLVIPLGVAGGLVATLLPRVFFILPLLGIAAFTIAPIIKPFIGPLANGALEDKWDGEICLQSTQSTCGAASTVSILRYLGADATESELAVEAHSYSGGTEAWYLARAARARGFDVRFDFSTTFSPDGGLPAMVGVRFGLAGHFIAVLDREDDRFVVGDPLRGHELMTREDLLQRYEFTGFHMRIRNKAAHGDGVAQLVRTFAAVNMETEAEVQLAVAAAAASDRAIVFIHLDSAFMERQRQRFADFAIRYQGSDPSGDVFFQYIDCTPVMNEYRPLRSLDGWVDLEEAEGGSSLISAWGEVAWLQQGRVLHVQRILDFGTTAELIRKTDSLFGKPDSN